jgi:putative ABC transport system permease protein
MKPSDHLPPKHAEKLLLWFLKDDLVEEVLGDLEEKFHTTLEQKNLFLARLNYWYQVLNYLRPFAIRKSKTIHYNNYDMFQNYLKIGWRNLTKQKMYSSIKTGGFALGIAACLLIALFIRDELNYDLHYAEKGRIYRVVGIWEDEGEKEKGAFFPAPLAKALKEDYPEIEKAGRFNQVSLFGAGSNEVRRADQLESYYEEGFTYGDQDLLDILQIPMVSGSNEHALVEPKTIVISKRKADKYFPDEDPIGKDLILNNREDRRYTIKGVMEDFPATMHVEYDFIMTLAGIDFYPGEQENWYANNYFTYILLRPDADPGHLADKLKSLVKSYYLPTWLNAGVVDATERVDRLSFELQPITDIHLRSEGIHDRLSHGDIRFVWLFGAVAGFILIIACINFINLSTAKSANRAKEVGLRKVVGSFRINLINQFLTESLLFSFFSFGIGILLAWLLLPYFNTLASKSLIFPWAEWWLLPLLLLAAVIIGLLAALYTSFYLSSFKPIQVLKGI